MNLIYTAVGCVEPIAFSTNPGLDIDNLRDVWGPLFDTSQRVSVAAGRVAGSRVK